MDQAVRRRRHALFLLFSAAGIAMSSWVTRTRPRSGIAGMATISWGSVLASVPMVTAGLCAFGAGLGVGDGAVNVDGTDVEQAGGKTTLPALHGCFSLGTVLGATADDAGSA
ncbi:MFS transporter [Streptomyces sasae]|uniref:hypothetical protein n=1 Tax=Streptomyces sasae TaxID=1266772 RepID=UPI0029313760|nr:hypothetical protein [Streptomyces sasae]